MSWDITYVCVYVCKCVGVYRGSRTEPPPLLTSFSSSSCSCTHLLRAHNIHYSPPLKSLDFLRRLASETRRSGRLASPRDRRRVDTRIEEFGRGLSARVGRKPGFQGERSAPDKFSLVFWLKYDVSNLILHFHHDYVDMNTCRQYNVLYMVLKQHIYMSMY